MRAAMLISWWFGQGVRFQGFQLFLVFLLPFALLPAPAVDPVTARQRAKT